VEAAQVEPTVRQYLVEWSSRIPPKSRASPGPVSTTDPVRPTLPKGGTPARLGYYDNFWSTIHSCVIVGVPSDGSTDESETVAAQDMLTRFTQWQGESRIGSGRHHLRDGSSCNGCGSEHHALMRHPRQYPQKEQPVLRSQRFSRPTESNSIAVPCGGNAQLWSA